MVSLTDIRSYFNFLSQSSYTSETETNNEIFTVSFLNSNSTDVVPGYGIFHGTVSEIEKLTEALHEKHKATLHACLNVTDLKGRRISNIESSRVLALDLDHEITQGELELILAELTPGLLVESSPNKYHLYLKTEQLPLDTWKRLQLAIAYRYSGDKNLDDITKTLRVPGVPRVTKLGETFTPRIITHALCASRNTKLSYEQLVTLMPWHEEAYEAGLKTKKDSFKELSKALRIKNFDKETINKTVSAHGRNNFLYMALKREVSKYRLNEPIRTLDSIADMAEEINNSFESPLEPLEAARTVKSAYAHGEVLWLKRQASYLKKLKELDIENVEGAGVNISFTVKGMENAEGMGSVEEVELAQVEDITSLNGTHEKPFQYDFSKMRLKDHRYTELALVERLTQRFGNRLIRLENTVYAFCERKHMWLRQAKDQSEIIADMYNRMIKEDILKEKGFLEEYCLDSERQLDMKKFKRMREKLLSMHSSFGVIKGVHNSLEIKYMPKDAFDTQEHLLLCANGVLNLKTGAFRQAQPEDYMRSKTEIVWKGLYGSCSEAECPGWLRFLREIFDATEGAWEAQNQVKIMIEFIQEVFGYSISGETGEQKIFIHYGDGANGKSKLLQALDEICGQYSSVIEPEELTSKKNSFSKLSERFAAKIEAKRVGIIDDIDVDTVWNESFVKLATGPRMRARGEYETSREIRNRCKIHLGANVVPTPSAENYGILRRLCIIPYQRKFNPDPKESARIDKLIREEAAGILAWAVEGYQRVIRQGGIKYPACVEQAINEYQADTFHVEHALRELYCIDESSKEPITEVAENVNAYMREQGVNETISAAKASNAVKRVFKITTDRVWVKEKNSKGRVVALKLKISKPGITELL